MVAGALPRGLDEILPASARRAVLETVQSDARSAVELAAGTGQLELARSLLERIPAEQRGTVDAFLGGLSGGSNASVDAEALAHPGSSAVMWSWLLAARRCDAGAVDRWDRMYWISHGAHLAVPTQLGQEPQVSSSMYPYFYEPAVWGVWYPTDPNPKGTWVYQTGTPACVS
jgi:hypothetical protein